MITDKDDYQRDFLVEAEKIIARSTMMLPQREHLAALQQQLAQAQDEAGRWQQAAERAEARVKWLEEGVGLGMDDYWQDTEEGKKWLAAEPKGSDE